MIQPIGDSKGHNKAVSLGSGYGGALLKVSLFKLFRFSAFFVMRRPPGEQQS